MLWSAVQPLPLHRVCSFGQALDRFGKRKLAWVFLWTDSFETHVQMAQPFSGLPQLLHKAWNSYGEKPSTTILLILSNLAKALLGRTWVHVKPVISSLHVNRSKISLLICRDYYLWPVLHFVLQISIFFSLKNDSWCSLACLGLVLVWWTVSWAAHFTGKQNCLLRGKVCIQPVQYG